MESIHKELNRYIKENYNSNFHLDQQDWGKQEILKSLCKIVDRRIGNLTRGGKKK